MESDELFQTILRAIRNLRFGTLEIVVHDSKVVRIERHERIRLDIDSETQPHNGGTTSIKQI
jgi:hypothetical protein